MPEYMLLLRSAPAENPSPTQAQAIVQEYIAWMGRMRAANQVVDGNELEDDCKLISGHGDALKAADGPYAETKEAIGGYFVIRADNDDDAVKIASGCPGLKRGTVIEMHKIIDHS